MSFLAHLKTIPIEYGASSTIITFEMVIEVFLEFGRFDLVETLLLIGQPFIDKHPICKYAMQRKRDLIEEQQKEGSTEHIHLEKRLDINGQLRGREEGSNLEAHEETVEEQAYHACDVRNFLKRKNEDKQWESEPETLQLVWNECPDEDSSDFRLTNSWTSSYTNNCRYNEGDHLNRNPSGTAILDDDYHNHDLDLGPNNYHQAYHRWELPVAADVTTEQPSEEHHTSPPHRHENGEEDEDAHHFYDYWTRGTRGWESEENDSLS